MGGAVALISLLPLASAGACISEMTLVVGVGTANFDMQQVFDGQDAAELRGFVDQGAGNGDGQLTNQEVAAWEEAMSSLNEASVSACLAGWSNFIFGLGVWQAGEAPQELESLRATMDIRGQRSATSTDLLALRFSGALRYDLDDQNATVVVVPEGFEALSEIIECASPERIETNYAQSPCNGGSEPLPSMRVFEMRPAGDARIEQDTIQPALARNAFDGTAIVMADFLEDPESEIRFRVVQQDSAFSSAWIAAVAGAVAIVGALIKVGGQRVLFRLWWLASVFGFTRIRRDEALDHERREAIMAAIESEPGVHLGALQRGLGIATGTLVHHLRVLERARLVETRRRSNRVHFVPAGYRGPVETTRSPLQVRVLEAVRSVPGLSQSELAERLGEPRNTVAYNVRRLIEDGQIEARREGRVLRHFVPGDG